MPQVPSIYLTFAGSNSGLEGGKEVEVVGATLFLPDDASFEVINVFFLEKDGSVKHDLKCGDVNIAKIHQQEIATLLSLPANSDAAKQINTAKWQRAHL